MESTLIRFQSNKSFIFSHGGGPLPILGDPGHQAMIDFMQRLPNLLHKPDLILVISAHWEETAATLLGAEKPVMFYDYYGFPAQAYEIQYPASGSPTDAKRIAEILKKNNVPSSDRSQARIRPRIIYSLEIDVSRSGYSLSAVVAGRRVEPGSSPCPWKSASGIKE